MSYTGELLLASLPHSLCDFALDQRGRSRSFLPTLAPWDSQAGPFFQTNGGRERFRWGTRALDREWDAPRPPRRLEQAGCPAIRRSILVSVMMSRPPRRLTPRLTPKQADDHLDQGFNLQIMTAKPAAASPIATFHVTMIRKLIGYAGHAIMGNCRKPARPA